MATLSVSDFSSFINRQLKAQQKIEGCLWKKLEALIAVAIMPDGFYALNENILCIPNTNEFSVFKRPEAIENFLLAM